MLKLYAQGHETQINGYGDALAVAVVADGGAGGTDLGDEAGGFELGEIVGGSRIAHAQQALNIVIGNFAFPARKQPHNPSLALFLSAHRLHIGRAQSAATLSPASPNNNSDNDSDDEVDEGHGVIVFEVFINIEL